MNGKWKRLYGKQIMAAFMSLVAMISSGCSPVAEDWFSGSPLQTEKFSQSNGQNFCADLPFELDWQERAHEKDQIYEEYHHDEDNFEINVTHIGLTAPDRNMNLDFQTCKKNIEASYENKSEIKKIEKKTINGREGCYTEFEFNMHGIPARMIGFSLWTDKDYWSVDYIYPIDDKKKAKIVEKSLASVVLK